MPHLQLRIGSLAGGLPTRCLPADRVAAAYCVQQGAELHGFVFRVVGTQRWLSAMAASVNVHVKDAALDVMHVWHFQRGRRRATRTHTHTHARTGAPMFILTASGGGGCSDSDNDSYNDEGGDDVHAG